MVNRNAPVGINGGQQSTVTIAVILGLFAFIFVMKWAVSPSQTTTATCPPVTTTDSSQRETMPISPKSGGDNNVVDDQRR